MSLIETGPVGTIPWDRARRLLTSASGYNLRSECSDIVKAANTRAAGMKKEEAVVLLARYAFADPVIGAGNVFALPQSCKASPKTFGLDDGVPVCLVLRNAFEVFLPSTLLLPSDMPRSLRLLQPGDLFGVFEAADRMCRIGHQEDDWQVIAGARTSRLLLPFENNDLLHHLKKTLAKHSPKLKELIEGAIRAKHVRPRSGQRDTAYLEDWTWELLVTVHQLGPDAEDVLANSESSGSEVREVPTHTVGTAWTAEVLVFPPQWLKPSAGSDFQNEVLRSAWRQVRDDLRRGLQRQAIESASEHVPAIRDLVSQHKKKGVAVRQLLLCLDDVVSRRAVAYVPCTDFKADIVQWAGPFDQLVPVIHRLWKKIVRNTVLTPAIAVPTYLPVGGKGFVSFSRPTTASAAELASDRMTEMLSAVAEQISNAKAEFEQLIPSLDWDSLRFYANFQDEGEHDLKLTSLARVLGEVHCTNRYFHHCAFVVPRS